MKKHIPNQEDKLFIEENNSEYGAWLRNPANKFFLYSEGYKEAGKQLFEFCINNKFYSNTLVYPLISDCNLFAS